jgi:excisionase family DNA binding protein
MGMNKMQRAELLTKRDVAQQAKVCARTVDNWMIDHGLPYIKLGGAVRFLQSDVENFIERHRIR